MTKQNAAITMVKKVGKKVHKSNIYAYLSVIGRYGNLY